MYWVDFEAGSMSSEEWFFRANITYGEPEDIKKQNQAEITSCRESPVYNGYCPAHLIGDYLTTGIQTYIDREVLHKGQIGRGCITTYYW